MSSLVYETYQQCIKLFTLDVKFLKIAFQIGLHLYNKTFCIFHA